LRRIEDAGDQGGGQALDAEQVTQLAVAINLRDW
jgi:hypothetical protein